MNRPRARAVMQALLALSVLPTGFTSSELACRVREFLGDETYSTTRAAYDLRKLRCKCMVSKIARSRRYQADPTGLRAMAALLLLRQKVLRPLLAAASRAKPAPEPRIASKLDLRYRQIHQDMQGLFTTVGSAA